METSTNPTKRKKRRTRRCLDEIRKKSRRNYDVNYEERFEKINKASESGGNGIKLRNNDKCYITSDRLTLRPMLFSKAVRSETITRPQLSSKSQTYVNKPHTIDESPIVKSFSKGSDNTLNIGLQIENKQNNISSKLQGDSKEIEEISFHDESDSNQENDSPKSFIVFSPISQAIETEVIEESPDGMASIGDGGTSVSSVSSVVARTPRELYSEFMDDLSDHLDRIAPDFIQSDIMRRTHKYLREVYSDGNRQQTEQDAMDSFQCSDANMSDKENEEICEVIVENPIQYIRMGVQRSEVLREQNEPRSSPPPPAFPHSPQSQSSSPTRLSIINDTPEYTFYPRKLNQ